MVKQSYTLALNILYAFYFLQNCSLSGPTKVILSYPPGLRTLLCFVITNLLFLGALQTAKLHFPTAVAVSE